MSLISRNEREEQGSGHASETGEEGAHIPCPWQEPGEGVYIQERYAWASRERGRVRVCVSVWSPSDVRCPLARQKEERLENEREIQDKGKKRKKTVQTNPIKTAKVSDETRGSE